MTAKRLGPSLPVATPVVATPVVATPVGATSRGATLRVATLGCKVNQYETELVRQGLQRAGFADCPDSESADLCIVNTCTVTNEGDAKSRQVVRRLNRQNPDAKIVVMGCYATRAVFWLMY